jgi:hypothetical protein
MERMGPLTESDPIAIDVEPGPAAAPILGRAAAAMATRAQLTLDRVNDANLIVESLAAHGAQHSRDQHIRVRITAEAGRLILRFGPLNSGGPAAVLVDATLPGLGPIIERLADEVRPVNVQGEEHLEIVLGRGATTSE